MLGDIGKPNVVERGPSLVTHLVSMSICCNRRYRLTNVEYMQTVNSSLTRPVGDVEWHQCPETADPRVECGSIVYILRFSESLPDR